MISEYNKLCGILSCGVLFLTDSCEGLWKNPGYHPKIPRDLLIEYSRMSFDESIFNRHKDSVSSCLLSDRYRIPVEQLVSRHCGRSWIVTDFTDMDEFSSHPSAILSDGDYSVFVKLSEAKHGLDQFQVELAGLQILNERSGILIPTPIDIVSVDNGVILVLEAVQSVERTPNHWREIGRSLARIHQVKGNICGFERQGYFGPLYQDNRPIRDWLTFFIERRLWPRFMGAIDSGHLPTAMIRQIEKLIMRLPDLCIPEVQPTLLHGDAQQNNFISTTLGAMVIDPAVYFGNPEMDLAYMDYFQAVPEDVFSGYREILPIDSGFGGRRDLWRVPGYLAVIEVEGSSFLPLLAAAVKKYL
jgi:protein-ribulosamine 3-kinase